MNGISEFLGPIVTLAGFLHRIWDSADSKNRETIREFKAELDDFLNNVLGWHNKIVSFSTPLLIDMEQGKFSKDKRVEYLKLLGTIKRRDDHYSKSLFFVRKTLDDFQMKHPFDNDVTKSVFNAIKEEYTRFTDIIFSTKDKMHYLLTEWDDLLPREREMKISETKNHLDLMEAHKNAVVILLGVKFSP